MSPTGKFHRIDPEGLPYHPEKLQRKPDVGLSELLALDVRVGRVVSVEDNDGARDPAYAISVDFGPAIGLLVTSAKVRNYGIDQLLGRLVVGVINLGTRKIASVLSEFLILGALMPDGTVKLLGFDDAEVVPGMSIG